MSAASVVALVLSAGIALPASAQSFRFPLDLGGGGPAPYITAYRDQSGSGNGLRDWNCGSTTYDGHRGTDIGIGGFAAMDNGSRWVVAAAPGVVTAAVDGCFDRCTTGACACGAGFGNAVRVRHADGKSTWYGHLLNGSVSVQNGDTVACGQRLGRVGSSGNSTGPHLHFEPRYESNVSDDPFGGRCGGPESFWVEQGLYRGLPADRCEGGAPPPPPPQPPGKGTLRGVVFDRGASAGPSDPGNVRIPGAVIVLSSGVRVTARELDAYFELELDPGTYTYEATADGFDPATRTVEVTAGRDAWGSIGLARAMGVPPPPRPSPSPVDVDPPSDLEPVVPAGPPTEPLIEAEVEGASGCSALTMDAHAAIALVLGALALARRRR